MHTAAELVIPFRKTNSPKSLPAVLQTLLMNMVHV